MSLPDEANGPRGVAAPRRSTLIGIVVALAIGAAAIIGARTLAPPSAPATARVEFSLMDTGGHVVSDRTLRGRPYAILFGFTRCPDLCPTTLAKVAAARASLAGGAAGIQMLFVGIDTQHDKPEVLDRYLSELAPATTGLTGTPEQIARAARAFTAYYRPVQVGETGDSTFDHTATVYLVDRDGRLVDTIGTADSPQVLLGKLRNLGVS